MARKTRQTPEEKERERQERLEKTSEKLDAQIIKVEKLKDEYVRKAAEARRKGLTQQENTAKALLKRCMSLEKQVNGMKMSLDLTVQTRELSSLTSSFMEIMGELSDDIVVDNQNTNLKQTEKKYMKAMYNQKQQQEKLDEMIDMGNYTLINDGVTDEISEFDDEIDALINSAMDDIPGNTNSYRTRR